MHIQIIIDNQYNTIEAQYLSSSSTTGPNPIIHKYYWVKEYNCIVVTDEWGIEIRKKDLLDI